MRNSEASKDGSPVTGRAQVLFKETGNKGEKLAGKRRPRVPYWVCCIPDDLGAV